MIARSTVAMPSSLTVVSWNIHSGVGLDRRYRLGRVLRVLADLEPDIVGLQEVDAGYRLAHTAEQERTLRLTMGGYAAEGPTLRRDEATYGNLLLSRWPLVDVERLDLSEPGREPRGAIRAVVLAPGGRLAVHVFHLGLRRWEREHQAQRLLQRFTPNPDEPSIWMGDVNEWRPAGGPLRILRQRLGPDRSCRTFPAALPMLRLDRVWLPDADSRDRIWAYGRAPAPWTSDHLPLVARITWPRGRQRLVRASLSVGVERGKKDDP